MKNGVPRILMVRLSAIGDVVRVLPALHALRDAYPNAQIDWVVERKAAAIVTGHRALDEVLIFERPAGFRAAAKAFWALCRELRRRHYDMAVDFHGILKSGLLVGATGAPDRHGFARPRSQEGSGLFTNHKVKLWARDLNRIEENQQLASALGAKTGSLDVEIFVPEDVCEEVDAFFDATFESAKRVVAMHVPVDRPEKQWPLAHFAALGDMLIADGRFDVMLTWGPGQFDSIDEVVRHMRHTPHVAPETDDLKHYAWLAHRSDLYLGGDTGPMHIASAMGTPIVAIFGGTDPAKHAPLRKPYTVLQAPAERGQSAADRLAAIDPETAYDACVAIMAPLSPSAPPTSE